MSRGDDKIVLMKISAACSAECQSPDDAEYGDGGGGGGDGGDCHVVRLC